MKSNNLQFVIAGIIILGGLFLLFRPQNKAQPIKPEKIDQAKVLPPETKEILFELVLKNKKLISGPEAIKVNQGDEIVIKVTSDESEEFHLHGYDKSIDLEKDVPAELKFRADLTGRFPYELEKSKIEIGALEVQP